MMQVERATQRAGLLEEELMKSKELARTLQKEALAKKKGETEDAKGKPVPKPKAKPELSHSAR